MARARRPHDSPLADPDARAPLWQVRCHARQPRGGMDPVAVRLAFPTSRTRSRTRRRHARNA